MINKTTRLLALSATLLWGGVALAQGSSPTGSPTGAPSSSSSSSGAPSSEFSSGTTTAAAGAAPSVEAVLPADGTGIMAADGMSVTTTTTTETLPHTGGAPLLMALSGALLASGALFGLKKVR